VIATGLFFSVYDAMERRPIHVLLVVAAGEREDGAATTG
jgi:hypothetical protein